jgi:hypothetical protein
MAKGGILGALAKTAEAGIERAAKTAKAMQPVLPAAEREANLAKFLEPSAVQMRLYHGTPATEGNKGKEAIRRIKPSKEGALGSGSYLTPDPKYASGYANEGDANVLPVYAQLKNPLKIEGIHGDPMIEALVKLGMDEDQAARMVEKAYEGPGYIGKQVQNRAQAAGYDGLVQYRDGSPSEVVVYNPNAIKSAIGNQGTYDIYNPELSKASGGAVMMSKGGILGALARTAEKGMERATKAAPVAQRAIVGAQDILPTAERDANLAKFLEESKIKNRMYHGSRGKTNVSNPGEEGIREFKNSARQMTFASPNTDFANFYAGRLEPEGTHQPTMYPVYIQAKNPWDYENPEHIERILPYLPKKNEGKWSALVKKPEDIKELLEAGNWGLIENPKVIEAIQKAGFDAAHMQEMGVKNIGVFDPKVIKSATGNRGTYDIEDPDINRANGGGVTIDEFLKRMKEK